MNTRAPWLMVVLLGACEPLPPEPTQLGQTPEFTVLSATPTIGALHFSMTPEGHVEGRLVLDRDVNTPHPLRLAFVWSERTSTVFDNRLGRPILRQADQQLIGTFGATASTQPFSADLAQPPLDVRRPDPTPCATGANTTSTASLVAFVDVNENGVLDLTNGGAIDHVLSSSDFQQVILGDQRPQRQLGFWENCSVPRYFAFPEDRQPIYDHPLLDLVGCAQEQRFADPRVCGSNTIVNAIWFTGDRNDDDVAIHLQTHREVTVKVDGLTRGLARPGAGGLPIALAELGVGPHTVSAENVDGVIWEATFTMPDRTWIRSARPVARGKYEIDFKEIIGATSYEARSDGEALAGDTGTSSPLELSASYAVTVSARFAELPFRCGASARLDR
jgi:hypothetical protein